MFRRTRPTPPVDEGLQLIDALERDMVLAFDEDVQTRGIPADNAARDRVARVQLAAVVTNQLRAEYRARTVQR